MTDEEMRACPLGWYEATARLKASALIGDRLCNALEVMMDGTELTDTTMVTFKRYDGVFSKGKNKGRRKPVRGSEIFIYVTRMEVAATQRDYEKRTGKCGDCKDGQSVSGWSATEGTRYRDCSRCKGTGVAR